MLRPGLLSEQEFAELAVDGSVLFVEDAEGRRVGSRELAPGDNAKALAKQMLRDKQKPGAFWSPIDYPRGPSLDSKRSL